MSFYTRSFVKCDVCGEVVETEQDVPRLGMGNAFNPVEELRGWIEVGKDHHLCPGCAKPYLARKEEMQRELDRLSGYDTLGIRL